MEIKQAIEQALIIQKAYPKYLLSGSLSLILQGIMPKRDIHDLDFVVHTPDFTQDQSYQVIRSSVYELPNDSLLPDDDIGYHSDIPNPHCLFTTSSPKPGPTIQDLRCVDYQHTVKWKRRMGRDKDKEDLRWLDGARKIYLQYNDKILLTF